MHLHNHDLHIGSQYPKCVGASKGEKGSPPEPLSSSIFFGTFLTLWLAFLLLNSFSTCWKVLELQDLLDAPMLSYSFDLEFARLDEGRHVKVSIPI